MDETMKARMELVMSEWLRLSRQAEADGRPVEADGLCVSRAGRLYVLARDVATGKRLYVVQLPPDATEVEVTPV